MIDNILPTFTSIRSPISNQNISIHFVHSIMESEMKPSCGNFSFFHDI